jgi:hypothetical protein|tara:strand:- start:780 stop:1013 length:234 start_codon:yes stop_codon:yes gene_type:complete
MKILNIAKAWQTWKLLASQVSAYGRTKEPVFVSGAVQSVAVILAVFGMEFSVEEVASFAVVINVVASLIVRSKVSPV